MILVQGKPNLAKSSGLNFQKCTPLPESKSKIFNGLKQSTSKPADNDARKLSFISTVIGNWHRLIVLNTYMYLMRIIIVHMCVEIVKYYYVTIVTLHH